MACSVVKTRESRPKTIEAGSLGGPGVNPFHSKEEAEISAVFAETLRLSTCTPGQGRGCSC